MFSYANARPNETALINYFEEIGVNWEDIAKSLLGWMSDDEVREWAEREGYDIFDDEEEEETEIRYFVCGLGYDTNGRITDYERSFGDFDDKDEAQDKFDEVVSEAEEFIDEFFVATKFVQAPCRFSKLHFIYVLKCLNAWSKESKCFHAFYSFFFFNFS